MKTLDIHCKEYLDHLQARQYSVHTLEKLKLILYGFIKWLRVYHQVETPDRMQISHLDAWQKHLAQRRTVKGFPLKPSTMNLRISHVKGWLGYLVIRGYVLKALLNVLERVKEPQFLPMGVLTHSQVKKLFNRIDTTTPLGYRNRALLEMLYSCGLRAKEVLGLDLNDINFDYGTALVQGKGSKDRLVPIGKTALRYLKSYVAGVRPFLAHPQETAVFVTQRGRRCEYGTIKECLKKYTDKLDLDVRVSSHTFRRSCTTEMIKAGANIYHVKELLGHESLETLKHYVKLNITDLKKTHEKTHPRERDE